MRVSGDRAQLLKRGWWPGLASGSSSAPLARIKQDLKERERRDLVIVTCVAAVKALQPSLNNATSSTI